MENRDEIAVFISGRESACDECGSKLGRGAWIRLVEGKGALCLSCADLDHLEFLPTGNAALTRRAKRASTLWAVVLEWSRARKRYERRGLLVEEKAIEEAEASCLEDAETRGLRAERRAEREAVRDAAYIRQFEDAIRTRYPKCPEGRAKAIAEHACRKYSSRVGRSGAAKGFDPKAIDLAVRAHVRHAETDYDHQLAMGADRHEARRIVGPTVDTVLERWSG